MTKLDDILSTANQQRTEKVFHARVAEESHIFNFIRDNSIQEGKTAIPMRFIYALYCEQHRPPIKGKRFAMYFKTFFKKYFSGPKTFYRLDPKPFNLPQNYGLWKELRKFNWKYEKTKYRNIKSTPDGWMIYLDIQGGREIYGFDKVERRAARTADKILWFYYGPQYSKFNFPKQVINLTDSDPELQALLTLKKDEHEQASKEKSV